MTHDFSRVRRRRQEAFRAARRKICRPPQPSRAEGAAIRQGAAVIRRADARNFARVEACGAHACLPKLRASACGGCGPPHLRAISVLPAAERRRRTEPFGEWQPSARGRLRTADVFDVEFATGAAHRAIWMRAAVGCLRSFDFASACGGCGPPIPHGIDNHTHPFLLKHNSRCGPPTSGEVAPHKADGRPQADRKTPSIRRRQPGAKPRCTRDYRA